MEYFVELVSLVRLLEINIAEGNEERYIKLYKHSLILIEKIESFLEFKLAESVYYYLLDTIISVTDYYIVATDIENQLSIELENIKEAREKTIYSGNNTNSEKVDILRNLFEKEKELNNKLEDLINSGQNPDMGIYDFLNWHYDKKDKVKKEYLELYFMLKDNQNSCQINPSDKYDEFDILRERIEIAYSSVLGEILNNELAYEKIVTQQKFDITIGDIHVSVYEYVNKYESYIKTFKKKYSN